MTEESDNADFSLVTPFWIDTDGYTDRDRLMFCCGVEFEMVLGQLESGKEFDRTIHTENSSRLRLLCGRQKRICSLEPSDDPAWTFFSVEAKGTQHQRPAQRKQKAIKAWTEEYRCGCSSKAFKTKRELLGYCNIHGESRVRIWPVRF